MAKMAAGEALTLSTQKARNVSEQGLSTQKARKIIRFLKSPPPTLLYLIGLGKAGTSAM